MNNYDEILKNEGKVRAEEVLEEILPILEDYFEGGFSLSDGGITYSLPNGQKIILSAKAA